MKKLDDLIGRSVSIVWNGPSPLGLESFSANVKVLGIDNGFMLLSGNEGKLAGPVAYWIPLSSIRNIKVSTSKMLGS